MHIKINESLPANKNIRPKLIFDDFSIVMKEDPRAAKRIVNELKNLNDRYQSVLIGD